MRAARGSSSRHSTLHIEPWHVAPCDTGAATQPSGREAAAAARSRSRAAFYDDARELALSGRDAHPEWRGHGLARRRWAWPVLRAMDEARRHHAPDDEIYERSLAWERVVSRQSFGRGQRHGHPRRHGHLHARAQPLTRIASRNRMRLVAGLQRRGLQHQGDGGLGGASVRAPSPTRVGKLFDAIAAIVSNGKLALEQGDMKSTWAS